MAIGGHHHQSVVLQQQQRAIQREARLFHRDGEDGLRDHGRQHARSESAPAPPASAAAPENSRATFRRCACASGRTPGWPNGSPAASPRDRHPAAGARNPAAACAGMVPAPCFFTRAGHEQRIPNSRSVAVRLIRSPIASTSTLDRIGMVVFFSTTPCERFSSRTRSVLLTVNSIVSPARLSLPQLLALFSLYLSRVHHLEPYSVGSVEMLISL